MKQLVTLLMVVMVTAVEPFDLNKEGRENEEKDLETNMRVGASTILPYIPSARPSDCADHLLAGATVSGVYEIYPFTCSCQSSVLVWCDMETDGGGWTVFLNRQEADPQEDFNRTWGDYKYGFGDPNKEYWLGNELLHQMTTTRLYSLRVDLQLDSGGSNFLMQEIVRISDEENKYRITLEGYRSTTLGYSISFVYLNGRSFTTIDKDYDSYTGNCAAIEGGGWWYYNCRNFNPTNGVFNQTLTVTSYYGYDLVNVKGLQIKLRPKICDAPVKKVQLKDLDCGCNLPQ